MMSPASSFWLSFKTQFEKLFGDLAKVCTWLSATPVRTLHHCITWQSDGLMVSYSTLQNTVCHPPTTDGYLHQPQTKDSP